MVCVPKITHIVIGLYASEKKHRQSFERLRRYVEEVGGSDTAQSCNDALSYSLVNMIFDAKDNVLTTEDNQEVDVVLHKVSTLSPNASSTLMEWCGVVSLRRHERGLPPVVIVDPLSSAEYVTRRSRVYERLGSKLPLPLCITPRSWLWARGDLSMRALLSPSYLLPHDRRDTTWWIAKTDLATGPSYTHRMVVWRGPRPEAALPPSVLALLPVESTSFVVQEFFIEAVPFVIKVYCIGMFVGAKVVSTTPLLQLLRGQALGDGNAEAIGEEPVCFDSQKVFTDKEEWKSDTELARCWQNFLSEGGHGYVQCAHIAAQLAQELHLTLFGFDLLLVPRGRPANDCPLLEMDRASLFDSVTGAPTPLLSEALPVVVDVNYFPSFSGVRHMEQHVLDVIKTKVFGAGLQHGSC
ncbi:hypothetical protein ERJ75_000425300 [Trypanosoma vivax]|uniref:Uncharacterized protein n=1 Tax=Trypanosoma vivax (strain Y486) TaxID=1055687 RepID=G0U1M5_TRYVY|nr:hypothetical protein TRVL_00953 [Trypanosoma vivax]KAH8616905.1 hypothetical protein ERJ75_000425300 [Trypanosoma vivax]CCC49982.1 conserved hypothetical protein [Trypanosoma vivax Y486]